MMLHSVSFQAMGSRCELRVYVADQEQAVAVSDAAIKEVRRLEEKYTRFKSTSITSAINSTSGRRSPFKVDRETEQLLDYANTLYQQNNLFDITSGVLRQTWDFRSNTLPSDAAIAAVLPKIGWDKVEWQPPYIRLPLAGMEIDFGGYVKEYAADAVATICQSIGVRHGLVNLGGDIKIIGPHWDGKPWQVGIQHPRIPETAIATVELENGAIATSGDYERFMIVDGVRYCHLLDPRSGRSVRPRYASVSVVASQCVVSGSLATLAMLESGVSGQESGCGRIDDMGVPYLAVSEDMSISGSVDRVHESIACSLNP